MRLIDELQQMVAARVTTPPTDPEVEEHCPFLWQMLTFDKWADGSERMLPVIKIERVSGGYKVTLQDDALCIKKSAMCQTLAGCPAALEKALVDQELPWESFKSYKNKQGPKVPEATSPRQKKRR